MKLKPIEISEPNFPENYLQIEVKERKQFEKLVKVDTIFKHKNTYYHIEDDKIFLFKEVKDEKED